METFRKNIATLKMLVRHSLCNLQRCAFIAAFTSEKRWMIKSLFRNLQLIPACICQSVYDINQETQLGGAQEPRCLIANYCTRWHRSFKGLSQDGRWADFCKNLRVSLFNDDLRMSLISPGSISLDITFKLTAELDSVTLDSPLNFGHCVEKSILFCTEEADPSASGRLCRPEVRLRCSHQLRKALHKNRIEQNSYFFLFQYTMIYMRKNKSTAQIEIKDRFLRIQR